MSRPKTKHEKTLFGRFVEKEGLTYEEVAGALGVTRQYANFIAVGRAFPGRSLMFKIAAWARSRGGSIPVDSWEGRGYGQ